VNPKGCFMLSVAPIEQTVARQTALGAAGRAATVLALLRLSPALS
jgi:hypothetical protein